MNRAKTVKTLVVVIGLVALMGLGSTLHADSDDAGGNGGWYCPWSQQMAAPPQGGGYGHWNCPGRQGGYGMMGGGMMGYYGRGYGYRMGYGPGPGYGRGMGYGPGPGYGNWNAPQNKPVTEDQAKQILENYIGSTGNPNLKLGSVSDKGDYFEGQIVTKDNSLVDTIQVNKDTGWFRFVR